MGADARRTRELLSPISHDDAAVAAVAALELGAGTYNVVDDEPVTRREYFNALAAVLGAPPPKFPPQWTAACSAPPANSSRARSGSPTASSRAQS